MSFNPKERLEQLRKNKTIKDETSTFVPQNDPVPLFQEPKPPLDASADLISRLSRLQNTVNELSGQLKTSNEVVSALKREKSELETKLLRLQYENSQLKVSNVGANQPRSEKTQQINSRSYLREPLEPRRTQSQVVPDEILMQQVQQSLEQVKKEPIENILKRKEHNFRALKTDPKQISSGNKYLKEFAALCKDYNKTLKKPVLVLKLNSNDFD